MDIPIDRVFLFFLLVASTCLLTRLITGLRNSVNEDAENPKGRNVRVLPYWIPYIGHALDFVKNPQRFLAKTRDSTTNAIIGFSMGSIKHNVVMVPSIAKTLFARPTAVDSRNFVEYIMSRIFDSGEKFASSADQTSLFKEIHNTTVMLTREPFLSYATTATVERIERIMPNLISFNANIASQRVRERVSNVAVLPGTPKVAEVDLFPLIRSSMGEIATRVLLGSNFVDNNPNLIQDLWTFDATLNLFAVGLPKWLPYPAYTKAVAARQRLNNAMAEFHRALHAVAAGQDPGPQWSDMSDVPEVIKTRAGVWRNANLTPEESAPRDTALLWAANANAASVVFWVVYHIINTPELLSRIREEIAPFAKFVCKQNSIADSQETPQLSLDLKALMKICPLLKSTFYETLRLEFPSMTYKKVLMDLSLTESAEDAEIATRGDKAVPRTYHIHKGEYMIVPHFAHQMDPKYFPEPEKFVPGRFVVDGEAEVDMKTMTPFGGGKTMCKGRALAEREILAFVAGLMTIWDIELVEKQGRHPGHEGGAGAFKPKRNLRARMSKRA